ncbi:MAG: DNA helicase [Pseudomonadota bacterium]
MRLSTPIYRLKRRARLLARKQNLPLHRSLDAVAQKEGFQSWAHLAASAASRQPANRLLNDLRSGDLVLLGARPGHGKTMLSAEMAIEAARQGRPSFFFSLQDNRSELRDRFRELGVDPGRELPTLQLDTSDDIDAAYIIDRTSEISGNPFVVIDYLQVIGEQNDWQSLDRQLVELRAQAKRTGAVIVVLSQIDRAFEPAGSTVPDVANVRCADQLDLSVFGHACFLHEGQIELSAIA